MSVSLKRYRLEVDLNCINAGEMEFTREIMLRLIDSFDVPTSPFGEPGDFDREWDSYEKWMGNCMQLAKPEWLDALHHFTQNLPAKEDVSDPEDYILSLHRFLAELAELFPEKAKQVFGSEIKNVRFIE